MYVNISKYCNYFGPYQLVEKIFFWTKKGDEFPEWVDNLAKKFADSWAGERWSKIAQRMYDRCEAERIQVKIDPWDTWNMESTLAPIILPMLVQLKETKHGAPRVDDEDVPYELRRESDLEFGEDPDDFTTDKFWFDRWDYVLDEMIFAFESINSNWEEQFRSGVIDRITVPVDIDGNEVPEEDAKYFEWRKTDKDTSKWDQEGHKEYQDRISNGFRLFGKYFQALWD